MSDTPEEPGPFPDHPGPQTPTTLTIKAPTFPHAPTEDGKASHKDPKPWERQDRESDTDWAYFRLFLESGYPQGYGGAFKPRSVSQLARDIGVARITLAHRSGAQNWSQRAALWDQYVAQRVDDAYVADKIRSRAKYLRVASKAAKLGELILSKYQAMESTDLAVPRTSIRDALALVEWARNAERQYLAEDEGKPDPEGAGGRENLENWDLESLETLHAIMTKVKDGAG